jgi:hypothetical protein
MGLVIVANLIVVAFSYGTLTEQVSMNRQLIEQNRRLQQDVANKLDNYNARLARIEVMLDKNWGQ